LAQQLGSLRGRGVTNQAWKLVSNINGLVFLGNFTGKPMKKTHEKKNNIYCNGKIPIENMI
jgi:hypothetical protein